MSRRLDYGQDFRRRQAAYGLSVKDETELKKNDAAARWLQSNENRFSQKADRCPPAQSSASSKVKVPRRKSRKHRHADLNPCDPLDQLAGIDMKQVPWR
jgi:hypothetical protein